MNKNIITVIFYLFFLLPSVVVHGASQGGFLGASIGSAEADKLDDSDTAFKLLVGYNANEYVGFEVGYIALGSFNNGVGDVDVDGVIIDLVGYLPLSERFSLLGRVGMFAWTAEFFGLEDEGNDLMYGVGLQYDLDQRFAIRAEYENYTDVSGSDISLLSAGVIYSF